MDDKTLNVPDWWPDEPIPIYHAKETLEPEMIWISSVSSLSSPYYKWCKEYVKQLTDKVNLSIAQDMCASIQPHYFTIEEDKLVPIVNEWPEEIVDRFNSIGCTSFMLSVDELERLLEEQEKEINK